MNRILTILIICLGLSQAIIAQSVGINNNNPDASAVLDITSNSKGILIPRLSTSERTGILSPATGLMVFDSTLKAFYFYNGSAWTAVTVTKKDTANLVADLDANTKVETEKTGNADKIVFTLGGTDYFRMNKATLEWNNSGGSIYIGEASGLSDAYTDGRENTGIGGNTLQNATTGQLNTAIGKNALQTLVGGNHNTAVGNYALWKTTGSNNVGVGRDAGYLNTGASNNIFIGVKSGFNNAGGSNNTMLGTNAGLSSSGSRNVFLGYHAGYYEPGSDKLYISNSNSLAPLVYGDFSTKTLVINDSLQSKYLKISNGAASGYLLRSDSSGNAGWTPLSSAVTAGKGLSWSGDTLNSVWTRFGENIYHVPPDPFGQVGIGTSTPDSKLEVYAANGGSLRLSSGASETKMFMENSTAGSATLMWTGTGNGLGAQKLVFITPGNDAIMTMDENLRKIGINKTDPTEALDVAGTIRATGLQLPGGAANGYILQTDVDGNASWVNPNTLASNNWISSGNNQYSNVSGNVGIGITTPNNKLDVQSSGAVVANIQSSGGNAYVKAVAPSGNEAAMQMATTSGGTRWSLGKSVGTETGANAGSDFFINRYADAGTYLGTPLSISRPTGLVSIGNLSSSTGTINTLNATTVNVSGGLSVPVTSHAASYSIGANDYFVQLTGSSAGQTVTLPASPATGRVVILFNLSSNAWTVSPAYVNASGAGISSITTATVVQLIYDGSFWKKVN